ncbi:MAG: hypothetical protein J0I88_09105, partial [Chryseobacterium sp.]|nr:hypothetical protein [Chryseobacterium sp.]
PSKNGSDNSKGKKSAMPFMDDDFGDFDAEFKEENFDDEDDDYNDDEEETGYNDVFEEDDED